VILDLEGKKVMGLNAVGSFVWGLLDGTRTVGGIADAVARQFDVGSDRATADVVSFLAALTARGLIDT